MSQRGIYGKPPLMGADVYYVQRKSSLGTWVVGGLLVGGAVLWAKHQSDQIEKLYSATGLPHQSFGHDLRERSKALTAAAGEKIHDITRRFAPKKKEA
jgi:hypothetical protein